MSETSVSKHMDKKFAQKPTVAFIGASWGALFIGGGAYLIGLWNSEMQLNEKGYYFTILLYGLFSSVSLQKTVRDKAEGIKVSSIYLGICWTSICISLFLLGIGLYNAKFTLSEKGFYAIAYLMALFASIAVQKNIRDLILFDDDRPTIEPEKKTTSPND